MFIKGRNPGERVHMEDVPSGHFFIVPTNGCFRSRTPREWLYIAFSTVSKIVTAELLSITPETGDECSYQSDLRCRRSTLGNRFGTMV